LIIASSCGIDGAKVIPYKPLLDQAIELCQDSHVVQRCIIFQRQQCIAELKPGRDVDWEESVNAINNNNANVPCVELNSHDPLYILYTSGTTGM